MISYCVTKNSVRTPCFVPYGLLLPSAKPVGLARSGRPRPHSCAQGSYKTPKLTIDFHFCYSISPEIWHIRGHNVACIYWILALLFSKPKIKFECRYLPKWSIASQSDLFLIFSLAKTEFVCFSFLCFIFVCRRLWLNQIKFPFLFFWLCCTTIWNVEMSLEIDNT
jgi:hypothetical protein